MLREFDDDYITHIRRFLGIAIGKQFEALKQGKPFSLAHSMGQQLRRWRNQQKGLKS